MADVVPPAPFVEWAPELRSTIRSDADREAVVHEPIIENVRDRRCVAFSRDWRHHRPARVPVHADQVIVSLLVAEIDTDAFERSSGLRQYLWFQCLRW